MALWFPFTVTKVICIILAVYLSINVFMNIFSKSKKERFVMTPLSLIAAIGFWFVSLLWLPLIISVSCGKDTSIESCISFG